MSLFDQAVAAAAELIRIPSVQSEAAPGAPFGAENKRALDKALEIAEGLGFRTFSGDGYYGYAEIGDPDKPLFGILGHLDVVPVTEGWKYPPFSGTVAEGYLWGRGAEDDKAPMIAALFAAKALSDEGLIPSRRIRFIFGCNEESGWRCIEEYLKREECPEMGFSPDADFPVIYAEKSVSHIRLTIPMPQGVKRFAAGTRVNVVPDDAEMILEKDIWAAELTSLPEGITAVNGGFRAAGKSAHGSTPDEGDNAALKLISFLCDGVPSLRPLKAFAATDGALLGLKTDDDVYGPLTMNAGVFDGDGKSLKISLDFRHPASVTTADIIDALLSRFGGEAEVTGSHPPLYVPKDHPLVTALREAYSSVTGEDASPIAVGGATYARAIPTAVAFGPVFPGEQSNIHQTDERVSLKAFALTTEIYKAALKKLCFG